MNEHGRKQVAAIGLGAAAAAYAGFLIAGPSGRAAQIALHVVPVLFTCAAAGTCALAAERASGRTRLMWACFAGGAAAWAAGDTAFMVMDLMGSHPSGALTIADIGYLGLIPAWLAALFLHPARGADGFLGRTLDALTVFFIAAALTAHFAILPIIQHGESLSGKAVALAYPVGDLVLITSFLAVVWRGSRVARGDMLIGAALALLTLADVLYARAVLDPNDLYQVGEPVDLIWAGSFVCLALATRGTISQAVPRQRQSLVGSAAVAFGAVPVLIIAAMLVSDPDVLLLGAVMVVLTRSVRLVMQLRENRMLAEALQDSIDEQAAMLKAREEFIAAASHQLRTPLTAMRLRLDEVREPAAGASLASEYLAEMDEQLERLQLMSESLLTLLSAARAEETARVDVAEAIDRVLARVAPIASAQRVSIGTDISTKATVVARPGALEEVLLILFENGIKHGGEEGCLSVVARGDDGMCLIEVTDQGPGMSPDAAARAFDPFFRAPGSRPGFGLGLAIAKRICDAAGARIALDSSLGRGTRVLVSWPSRQPPPVTGNGEGRSP